jgi:hypothetical protein
MSHASPHNALAVPFRPATPAALKWGKRDLAIKLATYGQANGLSTAWLQASLDAVMEGEKRWVNWLKRNRYWTGE